MSTETAVGRIPATASLRTPRACYAHHVRMASCPDCQQRPSGGAR